MRKLGRCLAFFGQIDPNPDSAAQRVEIHADLLRGRDDGLQALRRELLKIPEIELAVIAPDGHELARTAFFEPAYLDMAVRLKSGQTFATRWGPAVQYVLVGIGVAAAVAAMLHNGNFARRRQTSSGRGLQPDEGSEDTQST